MKKTKIFIVVLLVVSLLAPTLALFPVQTRGNEMEDFIREFMENSVLPSFVDKENDRVEVSTASQLMNAVGKDDYIDVVLTQDITLSGYWDIPKNAVVQLYLNGHTLSRGLENPVKWGLVIRMRAGATLCIYDEVGGGTITGGCSSNTSGAIWAPEDNHIYMYGGTIANNRTYTAMEGGGAIYLGDGSGMFMFGGLICNNSSEYEGPGYEHGNRGGAIYCDEDSWFSMYDGTISGNSARWHLASKGFMQIYNWGMLGGEGGGIYAVNATVKIHGGIIENNTAETEFPESNRRYYGIYYPDGEAREGYLWINAVRYGFGGGIAFKSDGKSNHTLTVSDAVIRGNSAAYGGGIYYVGDGNALNITDSTLSGNKASMGGAVYADNLVIKSADITGNEGSAAASAVYCSEALTVNQAHITGNICGNSQINTLKGGNANTYEYPRCAVTAKGSVTLAPAGVIEIADNAGGDLSRYYAVKDKSRNQIKYEGGVINVKSSLYPGSRIGLSAECYDGKNSSYVKLVNLENVENAKYFYPGIKAPIHSENANIKLTLEKGPAIYAGYITSDYPQLNITAVTVTNAEGTVTERQEVTGTEVVFNADRIFESSRNLNVIIEYESTDGTTGSVTYENQQLITDKTYLATGDYLSGPSGFDTVSVRLLYNNSATMRFRYWDPDTGQSTGFITSDIYYGEPVTLSVPETYYSTTGYYNVFTEWLCEIEDPEGGASRRYELDAEFSHQDGDWLVYTWELPEELVGETVTIQPCYTSENVGINYLTFSQLEYPEAGEELDDSVTVSFYSEKDASTPCFTKNVELKWDTDNETADYGSVYSAVLNPETDPVGDGSGAVYVFGENPRLDVNSLPDGVLAIFTGTSLRTLEIRITFPATAKPEAVAVEAVEPCNVDYGSPFSQLQLPETVELTVQSGTAASGTEQLSANVTWVSGEYDAHKAGTQTIRGQVSIPDNYLLADNVSNGVVDAEGRLWIAAEVTVNPKEISAPTVSLMPGDYTAGQSVKAECRDEGAQIKYTLTAEGEPSGAVQTYSEAAPILLEGAAGKDIAYTLTIWAEKEGIKSPESEYHYTISIPAPKYTLTVEGGTGSGSYRAGSFVKAAAHVREGYVFAGWESEDIELTAEQKSAQTTGFTMPEGGATITATYVENISSIEIEIAPPAAGEILQTEAQVTYINETRTTGKADILWRCRGLAAAGEASEGQTYEAYIVLRADTDRQIQFAEEVSLTVNGAEAGIYATNYSTGTIVTVYTFTTNSLTAAPTLTLAEYTVYQGGGLELPSVMTVQTEGGARLAYITWTLADGTALDSASLTPGDYSLMGTLDFNNEAETGAFENTVTAVVHVLERSSGSPLPGAPALAEDSAATGENRGDINVKLASGAAGAAVKYRVLGSGNAAGENTVWLDYNEAVGIVLAAPAADGELNCYLVQAYTEGPDGTCSNVASFHFTVRAALDIYNITINYTDINTNEALGETYYSEAFRDSAAVVPAEPMEGYVFHHWEYTEDTVTVTASLTDQVLMVDNITGAAAFTAVYQPVLSSLTADFDSPKAGQVLAAGADVTYVLGGREYQLENVPVTWSPASDSGLAAAVTAYTAQLDIADIAGEYTLPAVTGVDVTVSGTENASLTMEEEGALLLASFAATDALVVTSVEDPENITDVAWGTLLTDMELPENVSANIMAAPGEGPVMLMAATPTAGLSDTAETGDITDLQVVWDLSGAVTEDGEPYDPTREGAQTIIITGRVQLEEGMSWAGREPEEVTVTVTVEGSVSEAAYTIEYWFETLEQDVLGYNIFKQREDVANVTIENYISGSDPAVLLLDEDLTEGYRLFYVTYSDSTYTDESIDVVPVAADGSTVLRVYYYLKSYTLSLDLNYPEGPENEDTDYGSQDLYFGENAVNQEEPVLEGYAFGGWYTNAECTGDPVDLTAYTMPAEDVTLYAKWTANAPEEPVEPDTPTEPDAPTEPEEPKEPAEPELPDKPNNPANPEPDIPDIPTEPDNPDAEETPEVGDEHSASLFVFLMVLSAAGILLTCFGRKKRTYNIQ